MNKKESLKKYLAEYGEIEALKDISAILQELSQEWATTKEVAPNIKSPIVYALSDAAFNVANATLALEMANNHWLHTNAMGVGAEVSQREAWQAEFDMHMKFFTNLSKQEFAKLFKNKEKLTDLLKRVEFLKKQLQRPDDRKKD